MICHRFTTGGLDDQIHGKMRIKGLRTLDEWLYNGTHGSNGIYSQSLDTYLRCDAILVPERLILQFPTHRDER